MQWGYLSLPLPACDPVWIERVRREYGGGFALQATEKVGGGGSADGRMMTSRFLPCACPGGLLFGY